MQYEEFIQSLGNNVKEIRLQKGLTQLQLADMCEMEKTNIARIEQGRTNPTTKTLKIIADSLELSVKDLFDF